MLRGRDAECATLDHLLDSVRAGNSEVLVVRGEAGVGKSSLLDHLTQSASGCRVAHAAGVEYEMELAYAGLHQLCAPMLGQRGRLPEPQRRALETAFGFSVDAPADRFFVGLAVLSLLSDAAEERPLICVVDDAQWLDSTSVATIAFIARRLLAESVGLVLAVRDGAELPELGGLPQLHLRGLRPADARALLESVWPGRLDEQVRDRVVAESRGNPLALLELPRGLTPAELAGGFELPDVMSMAHRVESSFLRQLESLPEEARRLLLTAAAEPAGNVAMLWRAASELGLNPDAAVSAQSAGLIDLSTHARFRHPLVRSAVYQAASVADRQEVHRALAAASDPQLEPDRRAWHRAHATSRLDETIASELELAAGRAAARGGIAAAAAFFERATELTPETKRRGRRALAAAQARYESGALDAAQNLVAIAEGCVLEDLEQAQLLLLRAQIVLALRRGNDAPPLLLEAAKQLELVDTGAAREAYLEAIGAAIYAGRLNRIDVRELAGAAQGAPPAASPARPTDLFLDALASRFTHGYAGGVAPLRSALESFDHDSDRADDFLRWFGLAWLVAGEVWDDERFHSLAARAVTLARESGALNALPLALGFRAHVHIYAGEFAAAAGLTHEADAITEATGNAPVKHAALMLLACRGQETDAVDLATWGLGNVTQRGEGRGIGGWGYTAAVLYNGLGRYDEALAHARTACEYEDVGVYGLALVELIDAAARVGVRDEATRALRILDERATAAGTDWALGLLAWARAMCSDGPASELFFGEAIERLRRTRIGIHLARVRLAYGEWLRRENRRLDAREHLRAAHEFFGAAGAEAFADRARTELEATGERARKRAAESVQVLTPQEAQVARLAREGLTNPTIGAQLFISPRTVQYHLRKVFQKLDITSRNQLARVPSDRLDAGVAL